MTYYPVLIPTLCRFEHFKNCVESLSKNLHASETELVIGLDFPPSEKYVSGYKKIKDYISHITGFGKVTLFERTENLGASKNSSALVDYAFSMYDAYIYSEDDNVFSPYFLDFINKGLNKYKEDDSILAVCGYSYPISWKSSKDCVLQHQYFSAWGYGTWKEKNKKFVKSMTSEFVKEEFLKRGSLKKWKTVPWNLFNSIRYVFSEKIPLNDISRSFYIYASGKNVLMPVRSLVSNMGWDGSGEHYEDTKGIDFRCLERNDSEIVDVEDIDYVFSFELESIFKKLVYKKDTSLLILILLKLFGVKFLLFINTLRKRISRR